MNAGSVSATVARQELRQVDRKGQLSLYNLAQDRRLLRRANSRTGTTRRRRPRHFGLRGLLLATFAKPSTEFTKCLPSFFAFVSGLWLKTDAGPRDGENKSGEASNGATYPDVALTPCSR